MDLKERIDETIRKCDPIIWAEVVKQFPEVKTGDYPPDATFEWHHAMRVAIATWLGYNMPTEAEQEAAWKIRRDLT